VRAGDIQPAGDVQIINPDVVLATMDSPDARFSVELRVERGIGFVRADSWEDRDSIGVLPVDALFSPVRKVNYTVEHTRVGQVTDYDRVVLEVWTDQTMDPEETVRQSAQILIDHFTLFANLGRQPAPRAPERRALVAPVSDELYNTPVEDLKLSSRTLNCLRRGNIRTVGEVLERSREELLALRNFGERSLQELYAKLRDIGVPIETDEEKEAKAAAKDADTGAQSMGAYSAGAEEEEEEGPPPTTGRTFYPD
jgi:DNA-directed RNA polymerase subunit alpha